MLTLQRLEDAFQETNLMQASWVSDGITFFTAELIQTLTLWPVPDGGQYAMYYYAYTQPQDAVIQNGEIGVSPDRVVVIP